CCPRPFFYAAPPTIIYPLSLHDALPISWSCPSPSSAPGQCVDDVEPLRADGGDQSHHHAHPQHHGDPHGPGGRWHRGQLDHAAADRKSTRLNSSHVKISYAVFCLKKKKV